MRRWSINRRWSLTLAILFTLLALYAAAGALQGVMLFIGNKALLNWHRWGALAVLSAFAAAFLFSSARESAKSNATIERIAKALFALVFLFCAFHMVSVEINADRCLDAGGSFDFSSSTCDQQKNHAHIAFVDRHALRIALCVVSAAYVFGAIRRRSRTS